MIISFSGLDGAGKTTQISALTAHLRSRGSNVKAVTMYDDVSVARWLRRRFAGATRSAESDPSPPASPERTDTFRTDKNYFSWPQFLARTAVYVLDALVLHRKTRAYCEQYDVTIFDRYIHDSLVNLLTQRDDAWVRRYIKSLLALTPTVDLAIFLDAAPEEAFARKPEYPLAYTRARSAAYKNLFALLPPDRVVVASGDVEEVFQTVRGAVDDATKE